jgi:recombination protein RecT
MNAVAETKALTVADTVNRMEGEFKRALPAHIPSDRFTRIAVSAINSNPDLLSPEIDRRSLYAAVMKAAQDGLVIDGREAALVTFKGKGGVIAQYMPMVAGVLKKMRNSGEISNISAGIVYRNEYDQGRFKYIKGDTESLSHDPILFEEKGAMIGVYAVVTLKDGAKVREFMDMKQIDKVKSVSRSANSDFGPWKKWFEEMAIKSVLRKVSKLCPMSSDLDQVFKNDDETSDLETPSATIVNADTGEITSAADKPKRKYTKAAEIVKNAVQEEPPVQEEYGYTDAEYTESDEDELPL